MPEVRDFPFDDVRFQKTLMAAAGLLDTPRHFGLHPGGVVVAPGPISDTVPCHPSSKGPLVTQLDKDGVEALGLVKMDLLGNRALTTLDDCLGFLEQQGITIDLETIPEDDPDTARLLVRGETIGCFQIESPGMRHLLQQTGAHTMDDVIQAIALIRPGPSQCGMKDAYVRRFRGLEEPTPPHPSVKDLLLETHGVMLYQEDVMQVTARVAGMSLAEADQLRRALQKRRPEELCPLQQRFLEGALQNGVGRDDALDLWKRIEGFAAFAFCKAHAVTYGRIAYRAAWLKAHHPASFLTAFLLSETGYYPSRVYVEEARRMGVRILGPDVNRSGRGFQLELAKGCGSTNAALRVGLGRARGLSNKALDSILEAREDSGPFLSLPDFLERSEVRKDEAETLIQVGAFDAFDRTRPELLWRLHLLLTKPTRVPRQADLDPRTLAACQQNPNGPSALASQAPMSGWDGRGLGVVAEGLAPGQGATLFPAPPPDAVVLPGLPGPGFRERGKNEFRLLGLTIDAHPCQLFACPGEERLNAKNPGNHGPPAQAKGTFHSDQNKIRPVNPCTCVQLRAKVGARVTLRGWPAATRRTRTSKGEVMRFLTLEDKSGLGEVLIFPDVYQRDGHLLNLNALVLITGVVEDQMGACALRAERIW
jgi:DNA polymerase III alpha subunit